MLSFLNLVGGVLWTLMLGFVLHKEWGWFVTTSLHIAAPSFPHCVGLIMFVGTLKTNLGSTIRTFRESSARGSDDSKLIEDIAYTYGATMLLWPALGISYIFYRLL